MKDFLEGICEGAVMAFVLVTCGMMAISPTTIVSEQRDTRQSWLGGILAFVTFIVSIGVAMAIKERVDK